MFFATYKNTLKTLRRSTLIGIAFVLVFFVAMNIAMGETARETLLDENKNIVGYLTDLDPEYDLSYKMYIQTIMNNAKAWIMLYSMPIFCVVSTMLILNRDYSDNFYEVEKASGIKSLSYFAGRFCAILTVNTIVCLIVTFTSFNYYYFSRGCLENFSIISYLCDSSIRILRVFICVNLLAIVFYIVLTYMISSLFKNGFVGAIVGLGLVIFEYAAKTTLRTRLPRVYHNYFTTKSDNLYQYWSFFDTEWFNEKLIHNPFSISQMLLCISLLLAGSFFCMVISYMCVRQRDI